MDLAESVGERAPDSRSPRFVDTFDVRHVPPITPPFSTAQVERLDGA
jgi:hypothetical protein